jgi:hypothetical protein
LPFYLPLQGCNLGIKINNTPSFPLALVPPNKVVMVKMTKHSIQEWSQLFKSFLEDVPPAESTDALCQIGFSMTVPLKTPSKSSASAANMDSLTLVTPEGIRSIIMGAPVLEASMWDSVLDMAGIPEDLIVFLKAAREFLLDYNTWW